MSTNKESLIEWLKDAHAMEKQAVEILENQDSRIENYPEIHAKVKEHLKQSRRQADRVEECLEELGSSPSTTKKGVAKLMGNLSSLSSAAAGDEIVKDAIANFTYEHFEIASYRSLVAAAGALGEDQIKSVCQEILQEEEEMAAWLEQQIPQVTEQYLQREMTSQTSKR